MLEPEFLTPEELVEITGYKHVAAQREWLKKNSWKFVVSGSGRPIVARLFARMQLTGLMPKLQPVVEDWTPDYSSLGMR